MGMLYLIIFFNLNIRNEFINNIIKKTGLLDNFFRQTYVMGCNDYIVTKGKYFFYFLSVVIFICFFDISINRINCSYIKNVCKKEKKFFFFKTNKYLIDGVNEGIFEINEKNNDDNIDNIYDDCQLLKKDNNFNKNEISTSLNDEDRIDV